MLQYGKNAYVQRDTKVKRKPPQKLDQTSQLSDVNFRLADRFLNLNCGHKSQMDSCAVIYTNALLMVLRIVGEGVFTLKGVVCSTDNCRLNILKRLLPTLMAQIKLLTIPIYRMYTDQSGRRLRPSTFYLSSSTS